MQDTMAITRLSATHATFGIICFQSVLLSCFVFFFSRYVESLAKTPKGDFVIAKDKILGRKGGIAFFSTGPGKSKDLRSRVGPW